MLQTLISSLESKSLRQLSGIVFIGAVFYSSVDNTIAGDLWERACSILFRAEASVVFTGTPMGFLLYVSAMTIISMIVFQQRFEVLILSLTVSGIFGLSQAVIWFQQHGQQLEFSYFN